MKTKTSCPKTVHTHNVHTVSKCDVSGLLAIYKKILVLEISFRSCDFLDTLSAAMIFNWNNISLSDKIYSLEYLLSRFQMFIKMT